MQAQVWVQEAGSVDLAVHVMAALEAVRNCRMDGEGNSDLYAVAVEVVAAVGVDSGIVIVAGLAVAVGRLAGDAWLAACMAAPLACSGVVALVSGSSRELVEVVIEWYWQQEQHS